MSNDGSSVDIKKYIYAVYILQAVSFIPFLIFVPAIIGVMINYIKGDDVIGSWLQSHFIWQKNTFWFGLVWFALAQPGHAHNRHNDRICGLVFCSHLAYLSNSKRMDLSG